MLYFLFFLIIAFFLLSSIFIRVILFNPVSSISYGFKDLIFWLHHKSWRICSSGYINCYVGLFGKGKTLASVHEVVRLYKKYNNVIVYDRDRGEFIPQYVNVISNVSLSIPYIEFTGLQQIVDVAAHQRDYDSANGCRTVTIVLGDEFSVQLNSRSFKNNIDPLFLNTLLTCRHHNIAIIYNAQRFNHVDALLRQVTSQVIQCNKVWRVMIHHAYDAWDLENASNISQVKPLRRFGWFIKDSDYAAYDTLACVGNLIKACNDGDMISAEEILSMQAAVLPDPDAINNPSRSVRRERKLFRKAMKKIKK